LLAVTVPTVRKTNACATKLIWLFGAMVLPGGRKVLDAI
jgi:hypothetical protein